MMEKRKLPIPKEQLPLFTSVVTAQKIFRIVIQAVKRIDAAGTCLDLLSGIVRERVKVVFRLRFTVQQCVQVGIMHLYHLRHSVCKWVKSMRTG